MKRSLRIAIGVLAAILIAGGVFAYLVLFEREKPAIQLRPETKYIGKDLTLKVEDQKSGVAEVQVDIIQQGNP